MCKKKHQAADEGDLMSLGNCTVKWKGLSLKGHGEHGIHGESVFYQALIIVGEGNPRRRHQDPAI
jgi:hypothetical protein